MIFQPLLTSFFSKQQLYLQTLQIVIIPITMDVHINILVESIFEDIVFKVDVYCTQSKKYIQHNNVRKCVLLVI